MSNINPDTIHGTQFTEEDSMALHMLKNPPPQPEINGRPLQFAKYEYRPYPAAIYRTWTDSRKRDELINVARLNTLDLTKPLEREKAESLLPPWDSRIVQNDRELKDYLDAGWATEPGDVRKAEQAYLDRIANAAAERAFDDQTLSAKAKAEFDAADRANGADHLLDLPVPVADKKPRGRPKKLAVDAA